MEDVRPGKYRHFKGNEYRVLYTARHSETLEPMVVYQAPLRRARRLGPPRRHVERAGGPGRLQRPPFHLHRRIRRYGAPTPP